MDRSEGSGQCARHGSPCGMQRKYHDSSLVCLPGDKDPYTKLTILQQSLVVSDTKQ